MFCFEIQSYQKLYKYSFRPEVGRWKWLQAPICQSTNEMALQILENGEIQPPFVVQTLNQTAGKGQQNTVWESEPNKNLTFTMVVYGHQQEAQHQAYWNMHICSCLAEWLSENLRFPFQVKWPNDIYANQKKVAGILIRNQLSGYNIENSLIGIGMNVNQKQFSIEKAISLALMRDEEFNLNSLLENWLMQFQPIIPDLIKQKEVIKQRYLQHLYLFEENHWFVNLEGKKFAGKIVDVDQQGCLKVETEKGILTFANKEIIYKIPSAES